MNAIAQDSTQTEQPKMTVIKNDGAVYTGVILSDDAREILIKSDQVGKLYIPKHMIKSIKPYEEEDLETEKETEVVDEQKEDPEPETDPNTFDPAYDQEEAQEPPVQEDLETEIKTYSDWENYITTKNILSDNAMPIQRGESFVKLTPLGVEAGIPLTKNWSLMGFSSYWGMPVGIKTKYCFELNENAWFSIDAAYGSMAFGSWSGQGIEDGGFVGSTSLTFGDRKKNFTIKTGYGYIHERWENWTWDDNLQQPVFLGWEKFDTHVLFANFGGMMMLTDHSTFTFDAVTAFIDGEFSIGAGAALRFGRNPRRQWQLGGSLIFVEGGFIPVPLPHISYTFVFSERKRQ